MEHNAVKRLLHGGGLEDRQRQALRGDEDRQFIERFGGCCRGLRRVEKGTTKNGINTATEVLSALTIITAGSLQKEVIKYESRYSEKL